MGLRWVRVVKRAIQNFQHELASIYDILEIFDPSEKPKATNILVTGKRILNVFVYLLKEVRPILI